MLNLLYEEYPTSVTINDKSYPIYTDFRNWVAFFDMFNDDTLTKKDIVLASLQWFRDDIPPDINTACERLISFARADDLNPKPTQRGGKQSNKQILSYLHDSPYILGAFLQTYGINLRDVEYMHWFEFKALFDALPEDTPIKKRMAYRCVNVSSIKDKAEKNRIKKIQQEIRLPSRPMSAFDIGNQF
jgi:hypothetical protein